MSRGEREENEEAAVKRERRGSGGGETGEIRADHNEGVTSPDRTSLALASRGCQEDVGRRRGRENLGHVRIWHLVHSASCSSVCGTDAIDHAIEFLRRMEI